MLLEPLYNILVMGDTHCGSEYGLVPPKWQTEPDTEGLSDSERMLAQMQKDFWEIHKAKVKRNYDYVISTGDGIDGKQKRIDGLEALEPNLIEQTKMYEQCLKAVCTPKTKLIMCTGTEYHTGDAEQFEEIAAKEMKTHCKSVLYGDALTFDIGGYIFNLRHWTSNAQNATIKELESVINWDAEFSRCDDDRTDVVIRGHAHQYQLHQFNRGGKERICLIAPALQMLGCRFGVKKCRNVVNWGTDDITIWNDGSITCRSEITPTKLQAPKIHRL